MSEQVTPDELATLEQWLTAQTVDSRKCEADLREAAVKYDTPQDIADSFKDDAEHYELCLRLLAQLREAEGNTRHWQNEYNRLHDDRVRSIAELRQDLMQLLALSSGEDRRQAFTEALVKLNALPGPPARLERASPPARLTAPKVTASEAAAMDRGECLYCKHPSHGLSSCEVRVMDAAGSPDWCPCQSSVTAISPAREAWRPIETAPKDGTEVLVLVGRRVFHAKWGGSFHGTWVSATEVQGFYDAASHWQPLPPPPATREERE